MAASVWFALMRRPTVAVMVGLLVASRRKEGDSDETWIGRSVCGCADSRRRARHDRCSPRAGAGEQTPTNLRVTLQAPPLSGGSDPRCCSFTAFEGTDTIPLLGKATFTGFFETGCIVDPFEPEVSFCFRGLDFTSSG